MWFFVKLASIVLAGYAVATASPQDRTAMAEGAKALGRSLVAACSRPHSPCQQLVQTLRTLAAELAPDAATVDEPATRQRPVR